MVARRTEGDRGKTEQRREVKRGEWGNGGVRHEEWEKGSEGKDLWEEQRWRCVSWPRSQSTPPFRSFLLSLARERTSSVLSSSSPLLLFVYFSCNYPVISLHDNVCRCRLLTVLWSLKSLIAHLSLWILLLCIIKRRGESLFLNTCFVFYKSSLCPNSFVAAVDFVF